MLLKELCLVVEAHEKEDDCVAKQCHAKASAKSKEEGVVQHVNKDKKTGKLYISDWYDDDETVATYNKGKLKEGQGDKDDVKYTHERSCPWNRGGDCECGMTKKDHADHCRYKYGKDCTCGMSYNKNYSESQVSEGRDDNMMPLSYRPRKGHTIEAYGRKGMKNTQWRKYFKNGDEMEKWTEENDATIEGQRDLDDNEKVK